MAGCRPNSCSSSRTISACRPSPCRKWRRSTRCTRPSPVGKHKITLCTNLPCQLGPDGGSDSAAEYLKQKLGIDFGETTPDGKFTLKEGECMGSCGDAPVMLVNNHRMCSFMSREKIDQLLEELSK